MTLIDQLGREDVEQTSKVTLPDVSYLTVEERRKIPGTPEYSENEEWKRQLRGKQESEDILGFEPL